MKDMCSNKIGLNSTFKKCSKTFKWLKKELLPREYIGFFLISVGCHLELRVAITFYQHYHFLPT